MPKFNYTFRAATDRDFEFARKLHRDTLKEYVASIWGWDEDVQSRLVRERFDHNKITIIQWNGCDIGVLQLETHCKEWFLANIQLVPIHQGKGWGSRIIRDILERADNQKIPVTLTVLRTNPARQLYERLGFVVVQQDDVRYYMKREVAGS
ncbi:MAG: GNAT family N-acetyltransferase [Candidatus Margulisiibacteriota bacterium]